MEKEILDGFLNNKATDTDIKFFDAHSHFNIGFDNEPVETAISKRNAEILKKDYDCCNIKAGAFCSYSSVMTDEYVYESNEYMYDLIQKNDWMYQWVVLDPRQQKLFKQVERMLEHEKILGIKIHAPCHKYDFREYGDDIFSFANEKKCFVLSHPDNIDDMSDIVAFADKYPNMKIIQEHLGTTAYVDAIMSAKHGNIYTDTSGGASSGNNIIEYAVEKVGSEKIFFGTDGGYSCAFQTGRILLSRLDKKDKENILYKNAIREFKIW